jgi:hypothetical protein
MPVIQQFEFNFNDFFVVIENFGIAFEICRKLIFIII